MNLRRIWIIFTLIGIFQLQAQEEIFRPKGSTAILQTLNKKQLRGPIRKVRLRDMIEQGLRKNYIQQQRRAEHEILDYDWEDTKDEFWLPNIRLNMVTDLHKIGKIRRGSKALSANGDTPIGYVGLDLGDYTIFNWGKDYLRYLNNKERYKRRKENLAEDSRSLRHEITIKFFQYWAALKTEEAKKEGLRHSSFIYRYNKARVAGNKVSKQEYYQARTEYLQAQRDYFESRNHTKLLAEDLSELTSDEPGTRYLLTEEYQYYPIKFTLDEALRINKKNNPFIRDAKSNLKLAIRDLEIIHRENLPLPKFSMDLGAYTNSFSNSSNNTDYSTSPGSSDIDVVASINATWTITGRNGLFNGRKTKRAIAQKVVYEKQLDHARQRSENQIFGYFKTIINLQDQIKLLEAQVENARSSFDYTLENYSNKKTGFAEWLNAKNYLVESQTQLSQALFQHIYGKIKLAEVIGVEDFQGDVFENSLKEKSGAKK